MISARPVKRKFYNKWCYKLSLRCPGVGLFRYKSFDQIREFLSQPLLVDNRQHYHAKAYNNRDNMLLLINALDNWPKETYATRIETDAIDIYTNNELLFNTASKDLTLITWRRFAPDPATQHLLSDQKRVLCKHLPHKKYQFKVFLTPHRLPFNDNVRLEFVKFVKNSGDTIRISSAVEEWFMNTRWNWDRRYVFVDNEKSLLMLKLKNSDAIGAVYEYVTI